MYYFVGEFGTYTRLPTYKQWIGDVNDLARAHSLGALWFQYRQDLFTEDQTSYNVLRRFDDNHVPYPYDVQRLKCGDAFFRIVETIWGKCFDAEQGRVDSGGPLWYVPSAGPGRAAAGINNGNCPVPQLTHKPEPSITVFFPAYNDAGTIPSMVLTAVLTLRKLTRDFEIVVVNDGSRDHTAEVLAELEKMIPALRVVTHPVNRGYGGALRTGFASATKDLIFYTDGDAQYDPRELAALYAALDDETDFVNGYKIGRSDPLHRVLIGRLYHWAVRFTFGLKLRDVDCDFRLIRRRVFDRVELTRSSGVICVELMKKVQLAGFRIREVPVHHYHRAYGQSQFFNFRRVARTLFDLGRLWLELVVRKPAPAARSHRSAAPPDKQRVTQ